MKTVSRPLAPLPRMESETAVICVDNRGYENWLTPGRRYRAIADPGIERFGRIRVRDDEGEEYDYPRACFDGPGPRAVDPATSATRFPRPITLRGRK